MFRQLLTLTLDGITACDYLSWVADREPPALGNSLRSVMTDAEPHGKTVHIALAWNVAPPAAESAAALAGFALTPEVVSVVPATLQAEMSPRPSGTQARRTHTQSMPPRVLGSDTDKRPPVFA